MLDVLLNNLRLSLIILERRIEFLLAIINAVYPEASSVVTWFHDPYIPHAVCIILWNELLHHLVIFHHPVYQVHVRPLPSVAAI